MWLLSTDRAELHYFPRSYDADGGYAILSHTWDGDEQSLQDVRAIEVRCRANGTNPRDDPALSSKIRECCILAETHGYRWVWIDSCCIDKTSSSELSEAINSMYKWYQSSEVCFAYLKDVPSDDVLEAPESAFRKSRWHTRTWTLQELIAPDSVIFLSTDWRRLGTRAELSLLLQMISRVPVKLMLGVSRPAQYSACIRMSWASRRQATRIEDEAYCLMGLFGVNMPTNYGEGKRAFIRLQHEIMQHKECDMSLFAFGEPIVQEEIRRDGLVFGKESPIDRDNPWSYLLADSPRPFLHPFVYTPKNPESKARQRYPPQNSRTTGPFNRVELPYATATSYGVQLRLPVATIDGTTLAVILCGMAKRHFGLFLIKDDQAKDPQRPRYLVGRSYTRSRSGLPRNCLARLCDLGDDLYNLTFNGKRVKPSWRTIYIVPTASDLDSECSTSPNLLINCHPGSRFQLPRWLVDRFLGLQFEVDELRHCSTLQVISFAHRSNGSFHICFGTCEEHHGPDKPPLWAKVFMGTPFGKGIFPHDCSEDHLDSESWAMRSRSFGDADRTVRLSFTQSRRALPDTPAVMIHLELSGRTFESVLQGPGISLLSRVDHGSDAPCPLPDTLLTSWEPRHPWPQDQTLGEGRDSPFDITQEPFRRLLLQLFSDLESDLTPGAIIRLARPDSPSSHMESIAPQSASWRWPSTSTLSTPFARMLRFISKDKFQSSPSRSGSPVLSAAEP